MIDHCKTCGKFLEQIFDEGLCYRCLAEERDILKELIDKANYVGYGTAITLQIERIQRERDAAQRAAGEMRTLLESVKELAPDFLDDETGHVSKLCEHALSADCGKGYHHNDEWKMVVDLIRKTLEENAHLADGDVCTLKLLKQALTHAEKLAKGETTGKTSNEPNN